MFLEKSPKKGARGNSEEINAQVFSRIPEWISEDIHGEIDDALRARFPEKPHMGLHAAGHGKKTTEFPEILSRSSVEKLREIFGDICGWISEGNPTGTQEEFLK